MKHKRYLALLIWLVFLSLLIATCAAPSNEESDNTVKPKAWSAKPVIGEDEFNPVNNMDAWSPKVVMDGKGNAIIGWIHQVEAENPSATPATWGKYHTYIREYRNGSWSNKPVIQADQFIDFANDSSLEFDMAMDKSGAAIVVWKDSDGTNNNIYKREFQNSQWSGVTAEAVNFDEDLSVSSAQVAMDNNNRALIVWKEGGLGSAGPRIYKREFQEGYWQDATTDTVNVVADIRSERFEIATGANGDAIIVWDRNQNLSLFQRERRGGVWQSPTQITGNYSGLSVAMDDAGNTIVVWSTAGSLYKREYRDWDGSGFSWDTVTDPFNTVNGLAVGSPKVAMDNQGNAIIAWMQNDGTSDNLYMREYRNGEWTPSPAVNAENAVNEVDAFSPIAFRLAMDDLGNAIIVWIHSYLDGQQSNLLLREYRGGEWSAKPENSQSGAFNERGTGSELPEEFEIAMDNLGNAIVVWAQLDESGVQQLYTREYR